MQRRRHPHTQAPKRTHSPTRKTPQHSESWRRMAPSKTKTPQSHPQQPLPHLRRLPTQHNRHQKTNQKRSNTTTNPRVKGMVDQKSSLQLYFLIRAKVYHTHQTTTTPPLKGMVTARGLLRHGNREGFSSSIPPEELRSTIPSKTHPKDSS